MTSYLSSLGGTNSQLHGSGMPSYLDSVGGGGSAAASANVPAGGGAVVDGSPSSTVDTQVTHEAVKQQSPLPLLPLLSSR